MKKVAFYTLGCKLNYSETSTLSRMMEEKGYKKVDFTDRPDIFIINTCSVTDNADKKCHKIVREARSISPDAYIALVGCYAQLKPQEIASIPGVDAVLGAAEKFRLVELLDGFSRKPSPQIHASPIEEAKIFHASYSLLDRTRTFLKIQDGCDYSCTFCTIPQARGKSRSDTVAQIVETARNLGKGNVKEIVLTGVNTGDFGIVDGERRESFLALLQALETIEGIQRIRISSIEPNLLSDEIIQFVSSSSKIVPHFHIPLQSGSDKILKLMRRRYLRDLYRKRVEKIRTLIPRACIGVDVIVGFPGETQADFLETHQFLNELDISYLHVFTYSERKNTVAESMEGSIPLNIRSERSRTLHVLSDKKRRKFYEDNIGQHSIVLFENDIEDGRMHGFTENYIRVSALYDPLLIHELKAVTLTGINDKGMMEVDEIEKIANGHPSNHILGNTGI